MRGIHLFASFFMCLLICPLLAMAASHKGNVAYCVVQPISNVKILPDLALADRCEKTLYVTAALGEFEPGSFIIQTTVDIPDLTFDVEDLRNGDLSIDSSNLQLRYVKVWYQGRTGWSSIRQDKSIRVLVPELLLNDDDLVRVDTAHQRNYLRLKGNYVDISDAKEASGRVVTSVRNFPVRDMDTLMPLTIAANTTKQIWLTADVGLKVSPGRYEGRILLKSPSRQMSTSIPLILTVLPFVLQKPLLEYGLYYRAFLRNDGAGSISSELKSEKQLSTEFLNMRQHGVSNPTIYQPPGDDKLFEKVLQLRAANGLDNDTINYLGITTGNYDDSGGMKEKYDQFLRLRQVADRAGVRKFNVYGVDEADPEHIPKQFLAWDSFRKLGAGVFTAAWRDGPAERQYAGRLNFLVLGIEPDAAANIAYRKAGTAVYLYNRPQVGVEDPLVYRVNYGLRAWQLGFDGVMNYAYQDSMGVIWNDFDHPDFRDHAFTYPTSDGVIDTLAWEGFREAIDDVRYIATLKRLSELTGSIEAAQFLSRARDIQGINADRFRATIAAQIVSACRQFENERAVAGICIR